MERTAPRRYNRGPAAPRPPFPAGAVAPAFLLLAAAAALAGVVVLAATATVIAAAAAGAGLLLAAAPAAYLWRRAGRCPHGRLVRLLYALAKPLTGGLWRAQHSGPCPFPRGPDRPGGSGEPSPTAALVVANHTSPGDPMLLWAKHADRPEQVRPIAFLMARELYDVPKLKWFYDALDTIPVARAGRDMKAVKVALKRLRDGGLVGLFPEGGINHDPHTLRAATPGAAFLALATDAPVFPVGLRNAPRGGNIYTSLLKPARAEVRYGDPVDLTDLRGKKKTPEVLAEATERIMRRVADLSGFAYGGLEEKAPADSPADAAGETSPAVPAPADAH